MAYGEVEVAESAGGEDGHGDAGLHVEDAGAVKAFAVLAERHGGEGSEGEDGVGVAEQEDLTLLAARTGEEELALEVRAMAGGGQMAGDRRNRLSHRGEAAETGEAGDRVRDEVGEAGQRGGRVAGGLAGDEGFDEAEKVILVGVQIGKEGVHRLL